MDPSYSGSGRQILTSEVMEPPRASTYPRRMTSTTASPPLSPSVASSTSLRTKALVAGAILAAFTAYSLWVVAGHGYTGFLSLAAREPWAMQLLLDLVLACSFGLGWMFADARRRQITTWPFVIATVFLGSIGLLGYVVWRGTGSSGQHRP